MVVVPKFTLIPENCILICVHGFFKIMLTCVPPPTMAEIPSRLLTETCSCCTSLASYVVSMVVPSRLMLASPRLDRLKPTSAPTGMVCLKLIVARGCNNDPIRLNVGPLVRLASVSCALLGTVVHVRSNPVLL